MTKVPLAVGCWPFQGAKVSPVTGQENNYNLLASKNDMTGSLGSKTLNEYYPIGCWPIQGAKVSTVSWQENNYNLFCQ
jgi:hypothetical protein